MYNKRNRNAETTWAVHRHIFWYNHRRMRNTSWTKHPAISVVGFGFQCCAVINCNLLYDLFPLTRERTQASTRRVAASYPIPLSCDLDYRATFINLAVGCNQTRPTLKPSDTVNGDLTLAIQSRNHTTVVWVPDIARVKSLAPYPHYRGHATVLVGLWVVHKDTAAVASTSES